MNKKGYFLAALVAAIIGLDVVFSLMRPKNIPAPIVTSTVTPTVTPCDSVTAGEPFGTDSGEELLSAATTPLCEPSATPETPNDSNSPTPSPTSNPTSAPTPAPTPTPGYVCPAEEFISPTISTDIFVAPLTRNSEGSFITLTNGNILFAYGAYPSLSDHAPSTIDQYTSTDGGKTWGNHITLFDVPPEAFAVQVPSFLRLQDGRIMIGYIEKYDISDNLYARYIVRFSSDEGQTWTTREQSPVIQQTDSYSFAENDRLLQLQYGEHAGRIIIPMTYYAYCSYTLGPVANPTRQTLIAFYSDDNGQTFTAGSFNIQNPALLYPQEPSVVEKLDGQLWMLSRTTAHWEYQSLSNDGGQTWSMPLQSIFRAPVSSMIIKRIPQTGDLMAVWNDHSIDLTLLGTNMSPLTVAISEDDGATWIHKVNIAASPGYYKYFSLDFFCDTILLGSQWGGWPTERLYYFSLSWLYQQ
jgi:hypothetical protein